MIDISCWVGLIGAVASMIGVLVGVKTLLIVGRQARKDAVYAEFLRKVYAEAFASSENPGYVTTDRNPGGGLIAGGTWVPVQISEEDLELAFRAVAEKHLQLLHGFQCQPFRLEGKSKTRRR